MTDDATHAAAAETLATKIAGLELSDDELVVLETVLRRALTTESETQGFVKSGQPMGFVFESGAGFKGTDEELQAAFAGVLGLAGFGSFGTKS